MSNILHRTTLEYIPQSPTRQGFPLETYLINGDYSAVGGAQSGQPKKYWVTPVVGESVLLMDQAGRDAADVLESDVNVLAAETRLEATIGVPSNPLPGEVWSISVSGLAITVNHDPLVSGFVHTVVADASDATSIQVLMMYEAEPNEGDDKFFIRVFEKTTGEYADILAGEIVFENLGDYTLTANGTDLVEEV